MPPTNQQKNNGDSTPTLFIVDPITIIIINRKNAGETFYMEFYQFNNKYQLVKEFFFVKTKATTLCLFAINHNFLILEYAGLFQYYYHPFDALPAPRSAIELVLSGVPLEM